MSIDRFHGLEALPRSPDASVLLVGYDEQEAAQAIFPQMVVVGVEGTPKPHTALSGRTVYVWCDREQALAAALAEISPNVGVIGGHKTAFSFRNDAGQALTYIKDNIKRYERPVIEATAVRDVPLGVVDKDGSVRAPRYDTDDWAAGLLRSSNGAIKPNLANAIHALREHPAWVGVLAYNEFAMQTEILRATPFGAKGVWSDTCDSLTAVWLQREGINVNSKVAAEAVETVARDHAFHKVREFLDGVVWDGVKRVDRWLIDYVGAKDTEYVSVAGRVWLISAVARVRQPGVKADLALILEGPQGVGKSTVFDIIGGQFFTDEIEKLGTKDASMQAMGAWIIEMSELDAMTGKAEISAVKAFLARRKDRFRPPYGRRLIEAQRQCVFGGTVNPGGSGFLRDETGNRRFLPVKVGKIDLTALRRDRDQLWAEAETLWANGEPHWLVDESVIEQAKAEQDERREHDVWEDEIADQLERLSHRSFVTMREVLTDFLHVEKDRQGKMEQRRAGSALRILGWEPAFEREGTSVTRGWRKTAVTAKNSQPSLEF